MRGAREYSELFRTEQIGRLYVVSGSHARGRTFHIFVLPKDATAKGNGECNAPLNPDAVEVYGITGGQPGWTETYGWLHEGPWQQDFARLVNEARQKQAESKQKRELLTQEAKAEGDKRKAALLSKY